MAFGTNAAFGLRPVRYLNGSPWNGAVNSYALTSGYATAIYTGDPVVALADGTIGIGVVAIANRGVFMGCKYTDTSGIVQFRPSWTAATSVLTGTIPYALIADDPFLVFSIQETDGSGNAGTPLALADRNLNINFRLGTGTAATGQSTTSIDNSTEATTALLNLKILDLDPTPGNVVGNFANWLCTWNTHDFKSGTGVSGV